jgi:perosamine synthetase
MKRVVMNKIKLFDPKIDKNEEKAVIDTLRSHFWASGAGTGKVSLFEKKFNHFIGSKNSVAVNSGTAALHLALSLFDIKGKEVILPSLSFVSTAHAIIYNGGKPVFVDIDPKTMCIDSNKIKKAINKKTRMIIPVHFGGMPCDLKEIRKISKKNKINVVEDAAHAVGSKYENKIIGSQSEAVCFSFHPVKNLSMPTGGAITLNGKKSNEFRKLLYERRWCGISDRKDVKYNVKDLGWNYYMNEFSAAIGLEQLKKVESLNSKRKKIAKAYSKEIEIEEKISFDKNCSYHLFWIQVKNRTTFMKKMSENFIETGIHYFPIHKMKYYNQNQKLPITDEVSKKIVSIPIHPNLEDADIDKIIKTTNLFAR